MEKKPPVVLINGYDTSSSNPKMDYLGDIEADIEIFKLTLSEYLWRDIKIESPWAIYILNSISNELYKKVLDCNHNGDRKLINVLANSISNQLTLAGISNSNYLITQFISSIIK